MVDIYDTVFDKYKDYIEKKSIYSPKVVKTNSNTSTYFPTISFIQSDNIDLENNSNFRIDYYEQFNFTINIYTKNKKVGETLIAKEVIDKELQKLTSEFFSKLNFKKALNQPTPNLDTDVYRRTMQYQCQISNRGNIIRR